ncbi:superoxide dismutase family protein [Mucilaginibacter terrae]|uniref:Superoxide dismutase [Cu-Zn] n=1 Tax=Mucilaginibacter terrae TaxID=1955052 RepID=A0ABU3GVT7_9SPHI|nr:superoxide dismutase family protein [Mucilaginibacter terrae]MDT3403888.1 Cu-Zn family superoxide dismutase [Mucilaginibacter terrae]
MKNQTLLLSVLCISLAFTSCKSGGNKSNSDSTSADSSVKTVEETKHMDHAAMDTAMYDSAHADITATKPDTTVSGTAHFTRKDAEVELQLTLTIPKKANSTVAVHFHEHGDCGDMGKGAHGHWNPTKEDHGKWGAAPYHSGDIGNIKLDKDGKATFTVKTDRWTIGGPEKTNILNRSLIVHSGVDDYKTQPTGNSGSRIGCGVINKM